MKPSGLRGFFTIWAGQVVSLLGSGLTAFAIAVWVYQQTGSVTKFSFIALATTLPGTLLSPLFGVAVDRYDRRLMMMIADGGAALCACGIAWLLSTNPHGLWKIVVLLSIASAFESLLSPAYAAVVPSLVPTKRLGQFNGLIQLGAALPKVASPLVAGVLLKLIPIAGIVLIDFASFVAALGTLLIVRLPRPAPTPETTAAAGSVLHQALEGWRYLSARAGLLAVLLFLAVVHFTIGILNVSIPALILSFASPLSLGTLMSLVSFGLVAGSMAMSVWGAPKRRVDAILGFTLVFGLGIVLAGIRPSLLQVGIGLSLVAFSAPLIAVCAQVLWQTKVPPHLHGRVFALRDMVVRSALPLAFLAAGPLADRVFEPLMARGGALAGSVGRILGVGPGRGVGLMCVVFGTLAAAAAAVAFAFPGIRLVDLEGPDEVRAGHPPATLETAGAVEVDKEERIVY